MEGWREHLANPPMLPRRILSRVSPTRMGSTSSDDSDGTRTASPSSTKSTRSWVSPPRPTSSLWVSTSTTPSAVPSSCDTRPSGGRRLSDWGGGSTLITTTRPWTLHLWSLFGGCLSNYMTRIKSIVDSVYVATLLKPCLDPAIFYWLSNTDFKL